MDTRFSGKERDEREKALQYRFGGTDGLTQPLKDLRDGYTFSLDNERLNQQIEELKGYPGIKSVEREGDLVKVTYEKYKVSPGYWGPSYARTIEDLEITINFGLDRPVVHHDVGFVLTNKINEIWGGHYQCRPNDETMPMCIGFGVPAAKACTKLKEQGELISILQILKALWSVSDAQETDYFYDGRAPEHVYK